MMAFTRKLALASTLAALPVAQATAAVINVPADHATIQAAVAVAGTQDTIRVAAGTYSGRVDYMGKNLTIESVSGPQLTILTHTSGPVVMMDSPHLSGPGIPLEAPAGTLRGFTVSLTNPLASVAAVETNGTGRQLIEGNILGANRGCSGSAAINSNSFAWIRRNTIVNNGGGTSCDVHPDTYPVISLGSGEVQGNLIANNRGGLASGIWSHNSIGIRGNVIVANRGAEGGAAVRVRPGSFIEGNLFVDNGGVNHGAIRLTGGGAGLSPTHIVHNTFVGNAGSAGSAVTAEDSGLTPLQLRNNVVEEARGPFLECLGTVTLTALGNNFRIGAGGAVASGSCTDPGFGNTGHDPGFVGGPVGDYHLSENSPLIDSGLDPGQYYSDFHTDVDGDLFAVDGSDADSLALPDVGHDEAAEAGNNVTTSITSAPALLELPADSFVFGFTSSDGGAAFECDFDMRGWVPCTSPATFRGLAEHVHTFRVRAMVGGSRDRTPATRIWTVKRCMVQGVDEDETLEGGDGRDGLCGGGGRDVLFGGGGDDIIDGGPGFDVLLGGPGADELDGGEGRDVVSWVNRGTPVNVSLADPGPDGGDLDGAGDKLSGIESIWAGNGNDTLVGDASDNLLYGGPGADSVTGGAGYDAADYSDAKDPLNVDLDGAVGDDGTSGEGDTVAGDVEDIIGGTAADALTGNAERNILDGGAGNDVLNGLAGADLLLARGGDDTIDARDGMFDEIDCGEGFDSVKSDAADETIACEYVVREVPPTAPATPPLALAHLQLVKVVRTPTGYSVTVKCSNLNGSSCTGRAVVTTLVAGPNGTKKKVIIAAASTTLAKGALKRLALNFNSTGKALTRRWGKFGARLSVFASRNGSLVLTGTKALTVSRTTTFARVNEGPRRLLVRPTVAQEAGATQQPS